MFSSIILLLRRADNSLPSVVGDHAEKTATRPPPRTSGKKSKDVFGIPTDSAVPGPYPRYRASREELRRRLRAKIKGKREGTSSAQDLARQVKSDPASAMLAMGIDDPTLLENAKGIMSKRGLEHLKESVFLVLY